MNATEIIGKIEDEQEIKSVSRSSREQFSRSRVARIERPSQ